MTIKNIYGKGIDENWIKDVKWISKSEIQILNVYPEILKDEFWQDKEESFYQVKYLGTQKGSL